MKYYILNGIIDSVIDLMLDKAVVSSRADYFLIYDNFKIPLNANRYYYNFDVTFYEFKKCIYFEYIYYNIKLKIDLETNKIFTSTTPIDTNIFTIVLLEYICGFMLFMSKSLALHCSAVEKNNLCIPFLAESNTGKSTIAAYMALNGYNIVCDDILILENKCNIITCKQMNKKLRLRDNSFNFFKDKYINIENLFSNKRVDKYICNSKKSFLVNAIFQLEAVESEKSDIVEVSGVMKYALICRNLYSMEYFTKEISDYYINQITRYIPQNITVYVIKYVKNFDKLCILHDKIETIMEGIYENTK